MLVDLQDSVVVLVGVEVWGLVEVTIVDLLLKGFEGFVTRGFEDFSYHRFCLIFIFANVISNSLIFVNILDKIRT